MNPRLRKRAAMVILVVSIIGWPLSALTFLKHEQQGVLALSWIAITLTAADIVSTTDVRTQQDDDTDQTGSQ
jgi:hypothetical protein